MEFTEESSLTVGIEIKEAAIKEEKSIQGLVLTVLNIILCILLVLFLIYLIVLMKERNDLKKRIRVNNAEHSSELISEQ